MHPSYTICPCPNLPDLTRSPSRTAHSLLETSQPTSNSFLGTQASHTFITSPLATSAPHILQQPIPLTQPIQRIIALAHRAHEAAQRIYLVLASVAAVLVDFADRNLYRGVVFGFDDAVGGAALAGDVAIPKDH